ncbi:hypothetical protein BDK51DRAFT_34340 [Blyttiomyces helicus]|uniref:IGFBP N-terminal domain-containing protein n=1 Tax=Blyttiomyces helicus TaxID=388810 RepID=A0A4V1IQJ8_9FUNG|nr:hypothetical protein BDK51DRAFT_34340 [Blyttiomyces helicus]|eukprot:RKO86807.1 hypothetical protein BDK51DRAFT_34340 [Blyttiomyces helicus]
MQLIHSLAVAALATAAIATPIGPHRPPGNVGALCGGNHFFPPCQSGLVCWLKHVPGRSFQVNNDVAKRQEVPVHFKKNGKKGDLCTLLFFFSCEPGLDCVALPGLHQPVCAPGVCSDRISKEGDTCGGNTLNPTVCASDLICSHDINPDLGGTCIAVPKITKVGLHGNISIPRGQWQSPQMFQNDPCMAQGAKNRKSDIPKAGRICPQTEALTLFNRKDIVEGTYSKNESSHLSGTHHHQAPDIMRLSPEMRVRTIVEPTLMA